MAMLRSATRFVLGRSAPASRFFGRRNPASSVTSKRNYFHSNEYDFRKEDFDFTNWNAMEFLFSSIGFTGGMVFYHNVRQSRYNTAHCERIPTSDRGHYGQEKAEKKEMSEASMSN